MKHVAVSLLILVSMIGGVTRIQEILEEAMAHATESAMNCEAPAATGSEMLA